MGIEVKWDWMENLGVVGVPTSFTLAGGGGVSPSAAPSGVRTDSILSIVRNIGNFEHILILKLNM